MNAMNPATDDRLSAALDPQSVAVIGASENPEKIGGREADTVIVDALIERSNEGNPA